MIEEYQPKHTSQDTHIHETRRKRQVEEWSQHDCRVEKQDERRLSGVDEQ
jgi:hypothetical protein